MTAEELREGYHKALRARLEELDVERAAILEQLGDVQDAPAPTPRGQWSEERRKAHSRRMKRLHREGKFRR